jgi:hypothetical protein
VLLAAWSIPFYCSTEKLLLSHISLACLSYLISLSNVGVYKTIYTGNLKLSIIAKFTNIVFCSLFITLNKVFIDYTSFILCIISGYILEVFILLRNDSFATLSLKTALLTIKENKTLLTLSSYSGIVNNISLNCHPILFNLAFGSQENAYFAISNKLLGIIGIVFLQPTSRIFTHQINKKIVNNESIISVYKGYFKKTKYLSLVVTLATLSTYPISKYFIGDTYTDYIKYLIPLALSNISMFAVGGMATVLYSIKEYKKELNWNLKRLCYLIALYVIVVLFKDATIILFFLAYSFINNYAYVKLHIINIKVMKNYEKSRTME